jgi:hypothetical protein
MIGRITSLQGAAQRFENFRAPGTSPHRVDAPARELRVLWR